MTIAPSFLPRPSLIPSVPGASQLRLAELLQTTDRVADDVAHGRYEALLPAGGLPTDERWFTRIHGDDDVDIWLISWVPEAATELHDHGSSLGALTLLTGSLDEFRWDGGALRRHRLGAGDQAAFPLGWVHDVIWAPEPPSVSVTPPQPTLSVHAYSPPLTKMSYYQVTADDTLQRQRTVHTGEDEG